MKFHKAESMLLANEDLFFFSGMMLTMKALMHACTERISNKHRIEKVRRRCRRWNQIKTNQ